MLGFRRARYLTCFYCNKRTSTQYDGRTTHFECPQCEAMNYLDKNGDITDPPVATTHRESPPVRYVAARGSISPKSATSPDAPNSIFCNTCLQNQHLFTASLAQYLPDDPNDPEYAEREKKYYRFRKNLERRYPQICADCEPRVRARMNQAAYTAKTDLLRRMIDRTNEVRKVKRRGWLDLFDALGKWLWLAGLCLQLLWHTSLVIGLASFYVGQDQPPWMHQMLETCSRVVIFLPTARQLASWSITASLSSIWWNPRFVQTYRGFTKHISGLPYWYCYQVMAVVIRCVFMSLVDSGSSDPSQRNMLVAGHISAILFTLFLYTRGPRSIRTDTTPLFKASPTRATVHNIPWGEADDDENKNMSEILDDILHTAPKSTQSTQSEFGRPSPRAGHPNGNDNLFASFSNRGNPDTQLGPLNTPNDISSPMNNDDKMDWSPTTSKHRAFNTYGQRHTTGFSDAPTEPKKGPFWYRVPPAPITPAQRARNPPNQPMLRQSPTSMSTGKDNPFLRREGPGQMIHRSGRQDVRGREDDDENIRPAEVTFKPPSFFSQPPQNDPRNSLSDMFGSSFTLSQQAQEKKASGSWLPGFLQGSTLRDRES